MLIVTDIDDVLCDTSHRNELRGDWDAYNAAAKDDPPHPHMIALLRALRGSGVKVWAMTGRPEKWRMVTNVWLLRQQLLIDHLVMRPDDNFMTSPELKAYFLSLLKTDEANIIVLEDRDDVVTALRGLGYNVLQVFNQRILP